MWPLLLLGVTGALFAAPLVPALVEWLRRREPRPLGIDPTHAGRTAHFAERLRARCEADGASPDADRRGTLAIPAGAFPGGERWFRCSVAAGDRARIGGALVDGDLVLGRDAAVARWAHARRIEVGAGAILEGRVSADAEIVLAAPCRFSRVSAPTVRCGGTGAPPEPPAAAPTAVVPRRRRVTPGDLTVPPGVALRGDVVVRGDLVLGASSRVEGSVKAHGAVRLEADATVTGALVAVSALEVGARCRLGGPLVSEDAVRLGAGAVVGGAARPTTVSAPAITVASGAVVHGTLRARVRGEVVAASAEGAAVIRGPGALP